MIQFFREDFACYGIGPPCFLVVLRQERGTEKYKGCSENFISQNFHENERLRKGCHFSGASARVDAFAPSPQGKRFIYLMERGVPELVFLPDIPSLLHILLYLYKYNGMLGKIQDTKQYIHGEDDDDCSIVGTTYVWPSHPIIPNRYGCQFCSWSAEQGNMVFLVPLRA